MKAIVVSIGSLAFVSSIAGALTLFSDETAFINELDRVEIETFDQVVPGTVPTGRTVDLGFMTFRYEGAPDGGNGDPFEGQPLFQIVNADPLNVEFMGEVNADGTPSGLHFFDFFDPVTAFGGTFTNATGGARLTVDALDASGQSVTGGPLQLSSILGIPTQTNRSLGTGFFGFTTSSPFETIQFGVEADPNDPIGTNQFSSEVFRLDNVISNPPPDVVAPVPLPGGLMSMLAALGALALWRRGKTV